MGELVSLCALRARKEADKRAKEEAAEIAAELAEKEQIDRMLKLLKGIVHSFSDDLQRPYRLTLEEMDERMAQSRPVCRSPNQRRRHGMVGHGPRRRNPPTEQTQAWRSCHGHFQMFRPSQTNHTLPSP